MAALQEYTNNVFQNLLKEHLQQIGVPASTMEEILMKSNNIASTRLYKCLQSLIEGPAGDGGWQSLIGELQSLIGDVLGPDTQSHDAQSPSTQSPIPRRSMSMSMLPMFRSGIGANISMLLRRFVAIIFESPAIPTRTIDVVTDPIPPLTQSPTSQPAPLLLGAQSPAAQSPPTQSPTEGPVAECATQAELLRGKLKSATPTGLLRGKLKRPIFDTSTSESPHLVGLDAATVTVPTPADSPTSQSLYTTEVPKKRKIEAKYKAAIQRYLSKNENTDSPAKKGGE